MINPRWEPIKEEQQPAAKDERLRPIYPASQDLGSAVIERLIAQALPRVLPSIVDPLPTDLLEHHQMPSLADAYRMTHQPADESQHAQARRRLAFNELLLLQLGIGLKRHHHQTALQAPALHWSQAVHEHLLSRFPFPLTGAQNRVIDEIARDLRSDRPMNRLLQGDVGSGKTVVALYAMLLAVADRSQGALMAPTELLAEQHFLSISRMLRGSDVRVALLTGGQPQSASERAALLSDIESGEVDIVVGTHALLTESVRFGALAVVVIDEQHRFGVEQRAVFRQHKSPADAEGQRLMRSSSPARSRRVFTPDAGRTFAPHCLVMTATPIPRTLSMTVFGDLDASVIDELPPGRGPIVTRVVGGDKSDDVYRFVAQRVTAGEQAYVVVPAIESSEEDDAISLKNVAEHAAMLRERFLPGLEVAEVHGRLARPAREKIMQGFRDGSIHVLVATTVIEVGVDVPNASVMVVEHAERFGLAQLHQLRGRVGRGGDGRRSVCVLISEPTTEDANKRLEAIASTTDGFKIAELDLAIRGMGEFFGTRQSGAPPLRVAKIPEDMALLTLARRDAQAMLDHDPALSDPRHALLSRVLRQQHGRWLGLADVG
jgi:ATP-dependent DNA helicase RecG